jgi:Capsule assembly protein Wzi
MQFDKRWSAAQAATRAILFLGCLLACASCLLAEQPPTPIDGSEAGGGAGVPAPECSPAALGSAYIPVDSWVYPAMMRLYSLGYADTVYLGLRPWTRASLMHVLEESGDKIEDGENAGDSGAEEARGIFDALNRELHYDMEGPCGPHEGGARVESVYTIARGISGTPLEDSYHIGSTVVNDYGRPYENGFNNYSGASGYATAGRFALYVRGEFQGAPSGAGYSPTVAETLSLDDVINYYVTSPTYPYGPTTAAYSQPTIPQGPIPTATNGRFLEAYVSYQYLNHVFSFGKQDQWMGPGQGSAMAFSNNAQNFYSFEINRIEPLHVPLLSILTGPFRYEFILGALRGHTYIPNPLYELNPSPNTMNVDNPGDPWVHVEKVSFKPYKDLEFGFERTVLWGGEGHSPVTLHNFLKSFFSLQNVSATEKNGTGDPGARFGAFDFTWRLPYLQKWLTLYCDSEAHDDVSPVSAPRRAAYRPGLYLSHVPAVAKLDMRVEGVSTDPPTSRSSSGIFMYYEGVEKQGYTNQGQLFGDWIGREDKGGQAWVTYHLSGNEWIQAGYRRQKAARDFIPGGTTLNDFNVQVVKRIKQDLEINGNFAVEHYKAPLYLPGEQTVTTTNIQLTWYPGRKVSF